MKQIAHRGEVRAVEPGIVHVAIVASGACHACRARDLCGMGESAEKIIDVYTAEADRFVVGQVVQVAEEWRMAVRALLLAYVGALVVFLLFLVGALLLGFGEGWAVVSSLTALALYYGLIYLFRAKIEKQIYFTITKD